MEPGEEISPEIDPGKTLEIRLQAVGETHDDGEGELLLRIRHIAPDLPVAVALDFHTNLSPAMMENATVITGYRTYPHVDTYETGQRCGLTLLGILQKEIQPTMTWGKQPMLTHTLCQLTSRPPLKEIMDQAIQAESAQEVLNASVFGGFPMADIPHVGFSVVIVADHDIGRAVGGERPAPGQHLRAGSHRTGRPRRQRIFGRHPGCHGDIGRSPAAGS